MATYTQRFGLVKPAQDDYYDIDVQNANMDTLDAAVVAGTGVLYIRKLTQAQYDALTPSSDTLYIVTTETGAKMYIGSTPIGGDPIVELTQAQYDNMQSHDPDTLYAIPEASST